MVLFFNSGYEKVWLELVVEFAFSNVSSHGICGVVIF